MKQDFLYNQKILKDRRKELRNNQTEAEKILWNHLKKKQTAKLKFVRQYSVGPYILDFYCPKLRLAIELDGSQHGEKDALLYDKDRNNYLESINIKTIRFWNNDVIKSPDIVLDQIYNQASKIAGTPS